VQVILLLLLYCAGDEARSNYIDVRVDLIELNHCYTAENLVELQRINTPSDVVFDQLVFYDYEMFRNEMGECQCMPRVRDWCLVQKGREELTQEEYNKKNREHMEAWVKKYGKKKPSGPYVHKFTYKTGVPRWDGKSWVIIIKKRNKLYRIRSTSYRETWTQNKDPEIENQKYFSKEKRRGIWSGRYQYHPDVWVPQMGRNP
jgi:hypothetical protein